MALSDFFNGARYRRENELQQAEILRLMEANLQLASKNEHLSYSAHRDSVRWHGL